MKTRARRHLLRTTAIIGMMIIPTHAKAGPQGGSVTSGGASIETSGTATTINQSTDRAIIRWDNFDIDAPESVQFNQPSSSSITVNRIRDTKASRIEGHVGANGNIILVNPNGIVFGSAATVDVGGLVATTSDIEDDNAFMTGGAVKFTKPGAPDGKIVNNGTMTVRDGGLVGLVAPNVENNGIIQARLGKAILASGDIATIDFAGDGLIKLEVSDAVLSQSVINTGTITADGGDILMTAAQARGMIDALVVNSGTLRANTVTVAGVEKKGSVTLSTKGLVKEGLNLTLPRADSEVWNTGRIEAQGLEPETSGGTITVLSDKIAIGDGSYVSAAGDVNGGTIRIGGEYQGGPNLPASDKVFVSEHVILNAGSRRRGQGGTIILWSDTVTRFYGHADASGGDEDGKGGLIEVSSKGAIDFSGTVDLSSAGGAAGVLLLDPTDIVISSGANNAVSGSNPFTPTADNAASVLNISTLQAALASGDVIVQTRSTGAQTGNITVDSAITWSSGRTLTLDAHNNIVVNQAITGNNLSMVVGNDLVLNANISGGGNLVIQQASDATTVGIGTGATGVLNLSGSDLTRILDGWNEIIIGKSTATAAMDVRATTWTDALTLKSGSGVINVNGTVTMGANTLKIVTDGDIALPGALTGTGTLVIEQGTASTGIGLGASQAGTVNLTATEIGKITNGWANIIVGRTDGTGAVNLGALTWNDFLTIQSGTGLINVNGTQSMAANNLTIVTDADVVLTGSLTGTGTLSVSGSSAGTTMGFGNSQAGTINFDTAEVGRITNGWANLVFGRADSTGAVNVGALTWNDFLTMQSGNGGININGAQAMTTNTLTYRTNAINIGAGLSGTTTFTLVQSDAPVSLGLGNGQAGTLNLTDAEQAFITNGWASLVFGRTDGTGAVNVGALTWNDILTLQSGAGAMNINGTQTMAANNLTLRTDSNLLLGGALTGTGTLLITQSDAATSMALGDNETGTLFLDTPELANITNGWTSLIFGRVDGTGTLNIGAATWNDVATFRTGSGLLSVNGNQNMGANTLTLQTNADLAVNANLAGTGSIIIAGSAASIDMGIGTGQAGTLLLDDTELSRIVNGWGNIYFGTTTYTGAINVGARTWQDTLNLRSGTGVISINGNQAFSTNSLNIVTDANLAINGSLTSTGTLTINGNLAGTTVGLGNAQAGTLNLDTAEIGFITDGWANIYIGSTSQTGAMNVGALTWKDHLTLRTSTGAMNINGAQTFVGSNLTLTSGNLNVNADLIGTGTLNFTGNANNTSIGIGTGQAGTLSVNDSELAKIVDGWSSIIIGSTAQTGTVNVGAWTWQDSVNFRTSSGALNINGAQNVGSSNLTIHTNTNLTLSQNLVGTGSLIILGASSSTTMGIGDAQTGTLNLTNAELAYIQDGWSALIFGSTSMTGAMNIGARTWTDAVDYRTASGTITINGAQNMAANSLTIRSNVDTVVGAALTGTGTLNLLPTTAATVMGVGTGQAGTFSFNDTELDFITNGWSSINLGSATQTGALNVGARAWNDDVFLQTLSGVVTIAGAQSLGANNLTIKTGANLAVNANLSGTGILSFQQQAANGTMGIGDSQSGTFNFTNAELGRIADGWSNIMFGRADGTGNVAVGAYSWNDSITLSSGTGIITIAGAQTMGANNLTIVTDSNLAINANLVGTGTLNIRRNNAAIVIGVGDGQAGALSLSNAEIARFVDGWGQVIIGGPAGVGAINIGAQNWVNPMIFLTQGNIVINGVQNSTETSGTSLVYATTNGAFINNAGASAINPGGGRYLVYSVDEANDTLGGITRSTILTNKTYAAYGPALVTESGNVHLYSGVVARILYLTIDDKTKTYGNNLPAFTYTYDGGLVNGDALNDIILSYTLSSASSSIFDDAGTTRVITGAFNLGGGYTAVVTNGTLTVTKANIVVESDAVSREYGDANPAFTVSYTGFKNGDDQTDIDTLATASSAATILSNAGNYVITASGAADNNYTFTYINDNLTITKATLNATLQNASRTYGDANPTFSTVYTGFKNGENSGVIDTLATGSSAATATSNAGTYSITGSGALDNNYTFNYINGTLTVNKAALLATADNKARVYGDNNPALTLSYTGFKNGDTASVIDTAVNAVSTATALSDAGTYTITASGGADNNYTLSYANGTLTVNKAVLTAVADSASREYGNANPGLGVVYTGFKNSQTSTVIDTGATVATSATILSNVGTYATVASGASDNNYTFNYVDGAVTITKASVTVTADSASRAYGDSNPALGVTYTGLKNGETSSVIDTGATVSTAATALSNVGSYATVASGAVDNNYVFFYVNGALTVNKATLTATANDASRLYGDANPTLGVTYTGFKNGETSSVIDTAASVNTSANALSNAGSYAITASGAADNNYAFNYVAGTLTVNKATLTATAANATRVYGDANPAIGVTYSGFKNGETASVIDTGATASSAANATSNVGNYATTASGAADNNYIFNYVDGTLTVSKATLTATAGNAARLYGDSNPAIGVTYTGFKNGETSAVIDAGATASSAANATSNVGSYATTASGASDNNYAFTYVDGTLTVNKATLTATADNASRLYGDANPAIGVTYAGFKNGETSAVIDTAATASSAATATSNVGSYATTASGASDNNYTFTYVDGTLSVNKATLTATAGNGTRLYGDSNPVLGVTYSGFRNGETSAVIDTAATASSSANATSNVGSYTTTASGASDNNYTFTYVDGTLTVNKATLIATAGNVAREYGDANPAIGVSYTGFKNGETSAVIDTLAGSASVAGATSNAGTYATTASGASDNNYTFAYVDGVLTVNKATLTATAGNAARVYGDANPAIGVTYSGFKNGETASVIDTAATASSAATATSNAGSYATTASGAADNNYVFTYVDGTLTVNKATLTATAGDGTRLYGDSNPVIGVTYSGFRNGETASVIDTVATASSTANATSNVGSYTTTASGAADNNYSFTYVDGTLTVNKATLTATAGDATRLYGDSNPAIGVTYTGFKNGETSAVINTAATASSAANATSNVGSYATTASGASDNNYTFTYVDGTLTVNKATLTATANNASRAYGDANPALGVSYSGFKNGETASVIDTAATASSAATVTSNVGSYATTASGASDNNYAFTYADGVLSVNKAVLTATAENATRDYGDANPAIGVSYSGFKNGETASVLDTGATASSAATATSNVGTYATTASGASDNNYSFAYVDGVLTVAKAMLTVTAGSAARDYGDANPVIGVSYSGFKNGETASILNTGATTSSAATATSNVGTYATTASGAADNNYNFAYVGGTLTVNKATLTATANSVSRDYGDANPVIGVSYTGFKNGETASVIDTAATALSAATATSNAGTYATTALGASDNNYSFAYVDGVLTVDKATLTATANNASRIYGDANPALGITYTGFKNGENSLVIDSLGTASTGATALSGAGSYAITASGAFDNNYDFVYGNGTLTVGKATLTATANNVSRDYGDVNPVVGVTYTGFKNGEAASVINTLATGASAATIASNAGTYATTASGASDNNYDFVYADGVLTVNKATLTARADNKTRVYGDANPSFTVSYTGFKNGEAASVIDTAATASSTATSLSNVGTYVIATSGASDNNYVFSYENGFLDVTKATLTATVGSNSRTYGDTVNPSFAVTYTGFRNGDTAAAIDTAATSYSAADRYSGVGTYTATASGASDNNYDFTYVDGSLVVTKAMLTATADNTSRVYGDANPTLGATYTGFRNGENASVINTLATGASAGAGVDTGAYAITLSGAADDNYDFTYVDGALNVTKAMLTVYADNATRLTGEVNPPLTITYSGFKNGDAPGVLNTSPVASTLANAGSPVGIYAITAAGGADNNYAFTYVNGSLNVLLTNVLPPAPYVPPSSILPSTVDNTIAPAVQNVSTLLQSGNIFVDTFQKPRAVDVVVLAEDQDFASFWQQDHFLIAMTDTVENFYTLIDTRGEREREAARP